MSKAKHKTRRRSNLALKAKRARSWTRGEQRKELRRTTQGKAHKANLISAAPTLWEIARLARAARRAADPEVQQRRQRQSA